MNEDSSMNNIPAQQNITQAVSNANLLPISKENTQKQIRY